MVMWASYLLVDLHGSYWDGMGWHGVAWSTDDFIYIQGIWWSEKGRGTTFPLSLFRPLFFLAQDSMSKIILSMRRGKGAVWLVAMQQV